ncbi:hypothetical protein [Secundilactobacillus kimchicus]|uniref:hypothetical protein n=1 Tax=Secundilactobacillus kimchicus TaxID=528209 RepID=UPI0024A93DF5|nr:hypothetical protein [Secundilactobacillus kimchicus]
MSLKKISLVIVLFVALIGGTSFLFGRQAETHVDAKSQYNPATDAVMTVKAFKRMGRVHYHKRVFTYYSPNGSRALGMGAYTSDGTFTLNGKDKNGYLILANSKRFGTKIKTPLGVGVVHDRGTRGNHYDIVVK